MEDSWWNAKFCLVASLHEQAHIVHIFSVTCIFSSLRVRGLSILTLTVVLIPCHCGGMFQSMDMTPSIFHSWWALVWLSGWWLTNNADKNALDFIGGHYLWRTLASPWQFICLCHTSVGILVDSTAPNERSNCPPVSWTQFFPFFYDWNGNSSRREGYIFIFIVLGFIFLITK